MLSTAEVVLVAIALAAFAYPLVMRALAAWAHPARVEMAHLERELLDSPHLSGELKAVVKMIADLAFDWRPPIMLALTAPVVVPIVLWRKSFKKNMSTIRDEEIRRKFERFLYLSKRSDLAANPIATAVWWLEFKLLRWLLLPFGKIKWHRAVYLTAAERSERMFCNNHG